MAIRAGAKQQFALAAKAASDVLTYDELIEGVLEPVRKGTNCSGTLLYRYDEEGIVGSLGGSLVEVTPHYASELFYVDPIQGALFGRQHMPHAVVPRLFPEIDWARYQRGPAYNEFYGPHGVEDLLGLTLCDAPYGSPNMSGFVLTRSRHEPHFERDVVRAVDGLRPALVTAARRIERVAKPRRREQMLEATVESLAQNPTVIVDRRGRTVFLSRDAEAVLKGKNARVTFGELAVGALSPGSERTSFSYDGPGGTLEVDVRAVCTPQGESFLIATFAAGSDPVRGSPSLRWRLTRAETAVLDLLAQGLSNREMAGRLFVSLETVKTHVSRVLAKSGARSRSQLLVVLRDWRRR